MTGQYVATGSSLGDLIEFAPGINIQDIILEQAGNDLKLNISNDGGSSGAIDSEGDSITLKDWALLPANIERLAFFATGELDLTQTVLKAGTDGNDTLVGHLATANWITGGTGEDNITGGVGNDILSGNGSVDTIKGGAGADVLYGGSGDDILIGGVGADILIGGAGSDWASYENSTSGVTISLNSLYPNTGEGVGDSFVSTENLRGSAFADILNGDDGENAIEGGKGNDGLQGRGDDDIYVWNGASASDNDGADTISEGIYNFVEVMDVNGNLAPGYTASKTSDFEPDNGNLGTWSHSLVITGPQGTVYSNFILYNGTTSSQGVGTNPITWPANGWHSGYSRTNNGDQLGSYQRSLAGEAGQDTIELGANIDFADISFITSGNDLILRYANSTTSQITVKDQNSVGGKVENLQFHDGLSANLAGLVIAAIGGSASATAGKEALLVGASGAETLTGANLDDVIFGAGGNDIVNGDAGDDTIEGGAGADILAGGANSLAANTPNWGDTVSYRSSAAGVNVDLRNQNGTAAQIGGDALGDVLIGFENFAGSLVGHDTFNGDATDNRALGFGGNDILYGHGGNDVLVGEAGNDNLYGGDGEDNLSGGDGLDYLDGGTGTDSLDGGDGKDRLIGGDGNDQLFGGAGDDSTISGQSGTGYLRGGAGDDLIDGGAGDDHVQGEAGNDRLIGGEGNDLIDGGAGNDLVLLGANDGTDTITDTSGANIIAFDPAVSRDDIWLTQVGSDLRIGVIGGDTIATITGFYAASGASVIDRIQTADGQLLLNHSVVQAMIARMTAASASATPNILPPDIAADLGLYWDGPSGIAPRAPQAAQTVQVGNYGANTINLDDWPVAARTPKSENAVDGSGWLRDIDSVTGNTPALSGWQSGLLGETLWHAANGNTADNYGPYGSKVVTLKAGEIGDGDGWGGGLQSDLLNLDSSKAYEFTWYFKREGAATQNLVFGPGYGSVGNIKLKNAVTGVDDQSSRFLNLSPTDQAANFVEDRWYKVVAYVLPEGAANIAAGALGGVYDTTTGEKAYDITQNFRWHENQTSDQLQSVFFTSGGGAQYLNTQVYQPEVRAVDPAFALRDGEKLDIWHNSRFVGDGRIEGWANNAAYAGDGEARWKETDGPDGKPVVVLETGQYDATSDGGGNWTDTVRIDPGKAYKYTQYVRKSDITKHSLYIGIVANTNGKENLRTGAVSPVGYFSGYNSTTLENALDEDKWYKVVGYVLPKGTAITNASLGGIYDAETGIKLLDVDAYRWADTGSLPIDVYSRFFTVNDTTEHGFSTQFGAPSFSAIGDSLADVQADQAYPLADLAQQNNDASAVIIDASIGVTDHDGDITGYQLNPEGRPAKGQIEILNAATGQIRYTPLAGATGSDSFSLIVADAAGNSTTVPINIELGIPGINSAPDVPASGFAVTVNENSVAGATAGTLTTTDPNGDTGIDFMFARSLTTLVGGKYVTISDDGLFRLERDYGKVVVNSANPGFDYENGQRSFGYNIRVTDKNSGLNSRASYSTLNVNVGNVNEAHSLTNIAVDIHHYNKALGPFIPLPDAQGRAINLRELMLNDPESANVSWRITSVKLGGNVIATHPWSIDKDGSLHLGGAITAGQVYAITVEAADSGVANSAVSATLTLNVGQDDGFVANSFASDFDFDFDWFKFGGILAPVVLDLDGDGVELVSFAASNVEFDMDGDGFRDPTGWFGADDGLLVIDLNRDGKVNNGNEISFQRFVEGAFSDLEGLAFFDTNSNRLLDAGDTRWGEFGVWRDVDQDGVTDAGEFVGLTQLGLESISLTGARTGQLPNSRDNVVYATSQYRLTNGRTGTVGDTFLVFDPQANLPTDNPGGGSGGNDGSVSLRFADLTFDRKAKKYRMYSVDGQLMIGPKKMGDNFDSRAGLVNGNVMLHFNKSGTYGAMTALIFDLDGDGIKSRQLKKSDAWFDVDGNGMRDDVSWTGQGDGFLVIDRNGNGRVDDGSELSLHAEAHNARTSFAALGTLDSNRDGIISALDARFSKLKIWRDLNSNGVTDAGELLGLDDLGIVSINLNSQSRDGQSKIGRDLLLSSSFFTRSDGSTGSVGDVALGFKHNGGAPVGTVAPTEENNLPFEDITLPREKGIKSLRNLFGSRFPIGAELPDALSDPNFDAFSLADMPPNNMVPAGVSELSTQSVDREPRKMEWLDNVQGLRGGPERVSVEEMLADGLALGRTGEAHAFSPAANDVAIERRLALIVQDLAMFGASNAGEIERMRDTLLSPLDYYAA